jgi:hypothetical protein
MGRPERSIAGAAPIKNPDASCIYCAVRAPQMEGVELAAMPPGWFARACPRGFWGHIEPPVPDARRALPRGSADGSIRRAEAA